MESLSHLVTIAQPFLPWITGPAVTVAAFRFMPRAGPMRAVFVALTSKFRISWDAPCIRTQELQLLRDNLRTLTNQNYVVVTGAKGVGKSHLVRSATKHISGVINLKVFAGDRAEKIIQSAIHHLTNIHVNFFDLSASARRIVWWYRLIFREPPLVVMQVAERQSNENYAQITSAVRELVDGFGLRVVIDGSPTSIPKEMLATGREIILFVEAMSEENIWKLPQVESVLRAVEGNEQLKAAMFEVLGGIPTLYGQLAASLAVEIENGQDRRQDQIKRFLLHKVGDAVRDINVSQQQEPRMRALLTLLYVKKFRLEFEEIAQGVNRSSPDNVLRDVKIGCNWFVVPATSAIQFVLRHKIDAKTSSEKVLAAMGVET